MVSEASDGEKKLSVNNLPDKSESTLSRMISPVFAQTRDI